jgi:hypothetical protein
MNLMQRLHRLGAPASLELLERAALDQPVAIDQEAATSMVLPYSWLLDRVGDAGIKLTAAGYLPPAVVVAAMAEAHLDDDWFGKGNREDHTQPVFELRESAMRLRLLRKLRGALVLTPAGRALRGSAEPLWWHLATHLHDGATDVESDAGGLLLLAVAAGEPIDHQEHRDFVTQWMLQLGWRSREEGEPIDEWSVFSAMRNTLSLLQRIDAVPKVRYSRPAQVPSASGIAFARAALRHRRDDVDMRRSEPELPAGPPQIQFKPGLADELMRELAPLLAEEGIDLDRLDVPDIETLQRALDRAGERRNLMLFSPIGTARELALAALREAVAAVIAGDTKQAALTLARVRPESPDGSVATVASCIGVALGLLDEWLPGGAPRAPKDLGVAVRLPDGHWLGERAATDMLALARKGRAFDSLGTLITRQGGEHVLYGSALALAAGVQGWAQIVGARADELVRTVIV